MWEYIASLGVAGFLFFTIKGLLWLIIPAALARWRQKAKAKAAADQATQAEPDPTLTPQTHTQAS